MSNEEKIERLTARVDKLTIEVIQIKGTIDDQHSRLWRAIRDLEQQVESLKKGVTATTIS